jgi:hypothetical protein
MQVLQIYKSYSYTTNILDLANEQPKENILKKKIYKTTNSKK